jgi:Trk-type K+ transport system membrane component
VQSDFFFSFHLLLKSSIKLSRGSLMVPILLYLIVGGSLVITNRNVELKISTKEAFIITSLSWILLSVLCAVPFIYTQSNLSVVDSIFESMSGITTTGATILNNLDELPKGILIWRAIIAMVRRNWNCCDSTCDFTLSSNWWNATISSGR